MSSFAKFEHEGWERVADKYDSVCRRPRRVNSFHHCSRRRKLRKKCRSLDVGCGPGYVSAAAAKRGAIPTGLDFSQEMIAIARKMFPRIEFRDGDAQNLPFADAAFDRVVANFALLHVGAPETPCKGGLAKAG